MSLENTEEHQTFVNENVRQQKTLSAISRCLETAKVLHQGDRATAVHAVIAKLQADNITFRVSDRNWVVPEKNGQPINLQAAVDQILLTDNTIGDSASIQAVVAAGELTIEARSDLKTVAQKVAYVARFGDAAWAKLPQVRIPAVDMNPVTMGRKDYNRLTVLQKIQFQKRDDVSEQVLGQILRRP